LDVGTVPMNDLLMIALTLGFFAATWLYVRACERV
jgi:hypothetical protein